MKSFTIDRENNITAFAETKDAESASGDLFRSAAELQKLTADWPASRLVEIWNGIPGLTPVKKFTDRKTAITRIWKAIQSLGGTLAENVAPNTAAPGEHGAIAQKRARAKQPAKAGKSGRKPPATTAVRRRGTKTAEVLAMVRRAKGATLKQLMQATGWQAHSVRGFLSGTLGRKMGLAIASTRGEDGQRCYSVSD